MFNAPFADILPKSVIAAVLLWGGVHYFAAGPAIAGRVVKVDYLPACETDVKALALVSADKSAAKIQAPDTDLGEDFAADQLRRLRDTPFMRELDRMGGIGDLLGIGATTHQMLGEYERRKDTAKATYESALERLQAETASNLAQAGSICGCLGDEAISETRMQWAIFTGSLGLFRPSPLAAFDRKMSELRGKGRCALTEAPAP